MLRILIVAVAAMAVFAVSAKQFTVVIDAGHGGKDYGACGKKVYEKTVNLNVALKLGEMIADELNDVKVVYTRNDDRFLTLQQRADKANKANGDLFISIHTNSVDKSAKGRTTINGASTYTLGMHKTEENLAVAKRENSVIKLEDDFTTTYQGFDPNSTESYIIFEINQSRHVEQSVDFAMRVQREFTNTAGRKNNGVRQAGFWVLAKTSMPAVLVELDFICNPTVESFLGSSEGQLKLAKSIFNAVKSYKKSFYSEISDEPAQNKGQSKKKSKGKNKKKNKEVFEEEIYENPEPNVGKTDVPSEQVSGEEIEYRVQLFTSPKKLKSNDSRIKNIDGINYYYENGLYKYTCGSVTDKKEALSLQKKMRKQFSQAFLVTFKNGKRIK
ncbi:MAG: N-acetylmuramoyl-L-alanine amidase [Muribaculaceae bacterium]